jgi:hypothetical protein
MKEMLLRYIFNRLTEASSVRGLILTFSSFAGLTLSEQQTSSTVWIVLGIVGLLGSFLPDRLVSHNTRATDPIPVEPPSTPSPPSDPGFGDK